MDRRKLGSLCLQITDGEHGTVKDDPTGSYYYLNNNNITETGIEIRDTDRRIDQATFCSIRKRTGLAINDVVIATCGTLGKTQVIRRDPNNYEFSRSVGIIKPDPLLVLPEFIHYYFSLPSSQLRIQQIATGGVQKHFYIEDMENFEIDLPLLEDQHAIVSVLSAIDNKIANNKKLMAELEATARLIYDYWFTQFDFPDEGGKPYKSSGGKMIWSDELKRDIPESWHVEKVESLITVTKGVSYTSQDLIGSGIPMVNLASFDTDGTLKLAGMKTYAGIVYENRTVYPGDLLMCVTQQTSIDPTGKTNVLGKAFRLPNVFDETTIISTDVVKLVPKVNNEHSAVLNQLFKRPEIHKRITGFANGTKIKHLDVAGAMDFYLALPNSGNLIQRFAEISDFLLFREGQLLRENMRLHELRDWLLPMLMNGQLVVE